MMPPANKDFVFPLHKLPRTLSDTLINMQQLTNLREKILTDVLYEELTADTKQVHNIHGSFY